MIIGFILSFVTFSSPAHAQGYEPFSNLPAVTAQASAPITVGITRRSSNDDDPPPSPTVHPFTITGKDMDTWKVINGSDTSQFADFIKCDKVGEQYPSVSGPTLRGIGTDFVSTWDVIVYGLVIQYQQLQHPVAQAVYVNTYTVTNDTSQQGRNSALNDLTGVTVQQTIIRPAYQ